MIFTQFYPWVKPTLLPTFTQIYPTGFTQWVKRTMPTLDITQNPVFGCQNTINVMLCYVMLCYVMLC